MNKKIAIKVLEDKLDTSTDFEKQALNEGISALRTSIAFDETIKRWKRFFQEEEVRDVNRS